MQAHSLIVAVIERSPVAKQWNNAYLPIAVVTVDHTSNASSFF